MTDRWAPRAVREQQDDPAVVRAQWRHTVFYGLCSWLGFLIGFLAFEAIAPGAVRAAIRDLYVGQDWSSAWVLVACAIVVAFCGALTGTIFERISKHREP